MNELFKKTQTNPSYNDVLDIEPQDLNAVRSQVGTKIRIIDVREVDEFNGELGHIPEAELYCLGTIPERVSEFNKDQTLVMVCRSGARSARASAFLLENNFKTVYNLRGGMLLWNELNLPKK